MGRRYRWRVGQSLVVLVFVGCGEEFEFYSKC